MRTNVLYLILIFLNLFPLLSQLKTTEETKMIINIFQEQLDCYECIAQNDVNSSKYIECLSKLILLESTATELVNDQKFRMKIQFGKPKLQELNNKLLLIETFLKGISNIEKNKSVFKSLKPGSQICYYLGDERGGFIMIHLLIQNRNNDVLMAKVVGIDDYNPYDNLDRQIRNVNSAIVGNITYHVNEIYSFNIDHVSYFKTCEVIRPY